MSAASSSDVTDDELRSATFQLLFAPAEKVINNRFLDILKDATAVADFQCNFTASTIIVWTFSIWFRA